MVDDMKFLRCLALLLTLLPVWGAETVPTTDFPWAAAAPTALVQASVQSDRVLNEEPCDWRPVLTPLAAELVRDCRSPREAVLTMAAKLPEATGVYYSMERRKPCMNVLESLAEKKVSCTGQTILLVCALRAVGIPARAVGIATWNHVLGNHTWAEAWFDGEWHMIEFNERDFNTPWVMENIGMTDPQVIAQRITAATPQGNIPYITVLLADKQLLPAEDVTERYHALARAWYEQAGLPADRQRLMVELTPRPDTAVTARVTDADGNEISAAPLPTAQDDVRAFARLSLPREGKFFLQIDGSDQQLPLSPTAAPVQILHLEQ